MDTIASLGIVRMLRQKWQGPADPRASFSGLTVLVTGSNTGLGFEAANKFASSNCSRLILAVRTLSKGQEAARSIQQSSRRKDDFISVMELDMASYPSIRTFASQLSSTVPRLDIAVLNAGAFFATRADSKHGWERTLQVNTLSTVYLALLLLPQLKASRSTSHIPVLEFVSSGTHKRIQSSWSEEDKRSTAPLTMLNDPNYKFSAGKYYGSSKLFLMCALPHLVELANKEVYVTSVCPGFCKSGLPRDVLKWWMAPFVWLLSLLFMRSAEQGARTIVSGTTLGEKGVGGFWQHDELQPTAPLLEGDEGKQRSENVWREIVAALKEEDPAVKDLVDT